jgi:hypothetical protein
VTTTYQAARRRTGRGSELILLFFGGLVMSGPPRLRARDLETAVESPLSLDPAAMVQVITWVGAAAIVTYLVVAYPRYRPMLRSALRYQPVRWYFIFGLVGFVSVLWSAAPLYTLFWASKIVFGVLIAVLLAVHGRGAKFDRALRVLIVMATIKATLAVTLFFVDRPLVIGYTGGPLGYRLTGGTLLEDYGNSPMLVGLFLLPIAFFGDSRRKRRLAMVGYFVTWPPLLLSQGRTPIMAATLSFFIMLTFTPRARGKPALFSLGVGALGFAILKGRVHSVIGLATRGGEGVSNLTGRTDAFAFLMPFWHRSPIVGLGYGAGTRVALLEFPKLSGLGIGSGHDVLSTTLVDLGLVGVALLSIVFLAMWLGVFRLWLRGARGRHRVVAAEITCLAAWVTITSGFGTGIEAHLPSFLALLSTMWAYRWQRSAVARAEASRQAPEARRRTA